MTEALYTRPKSLRHNGTKGASKQEAAASIAGGGAHPGFFSRNIEGRCARKKVAVQTKSSTTTRNDRKLRMADCAAREQNVRKRLAPLALAGITG